MGERTALVDRLKLVLDRFEAKGGDGKLVCQAAIRVALISLRR
jgi:hypothetical protein